MKKLILIIAVAVAIGFIAWGIWFFAFSGSSQNNISNPSGSLPSVQRVSSSQSPDVAKDFLGQINADKITLGSTVVVSPYALQIWGDDNGGGEALLKYESPTGWRLVSFGGGQWNVLGLIQEGVPVSVAKQLVVGLANGIAPAPIVSSTTIPAGDMITIGTSDGSITMNNFYKGAYYIDQDQRVVVTQQTPTYNIVYYASYSSFIITVFETPFETARQTAEAAFWNSLGISQQDACRLDVRVFQLGQTNGAKLSFCTN